MDLFTLNSFLLGKKTYWMRDIGPGSWKVKRAGQSVQPAKRLQQTQWAGLEDTADLMGPSMCDDRYLSFEWVSVLGLTFVIKAGSGLRDTF
jgi:hypothetical protein